ncbi:MAG TPA: membrane protein insertase YidC [Desulfovibrio sp.]|nr:membrane protein insertase YidC [Desulfovibrio sp.]
MDNKRVIIALALSFAILFGWQYIFPPPKTPAKTAEQTAPAEKPAPAPVPVQPATPIMDFAPAEGRTVSVKTPLYTAQFNSSGGVLEGFTLSRFKETIQPGSRNVDMVGDGARTKAPLGLILGGVPTWHQGRWAAPEGDLEMAGAESKTLVLSGESAGLSIERKLTFKADSYLIEEQLTLSNMGAAPVQTRMSFTAASKRLSTDDSSYNPTRVEYLFSGKSMEEKDKGALEKGVQETGALSWASINSNYFLFALLPQAEQATLKTLLQDGIYRLAVDQDVQIAPGASQTFRCSYYMGPMDRAILANMPAGLDKAVDFGWFHLLAVPLLWILNWFYQFVHNYGISIILLTVLIKLLFWPLSQKSYKSMNQMKKLQPMIQKLREKYGDDKQRLNQEIMHLHKTYKVNPMGGCLPMIVQIPVFFGLYKALLGAVELRHAPFISHVPFTDLIWLADLSAKDPYYVTPLIMGATMFIQQKMTPSSGDPTQAKVMMFMPVVFTFLFLNFPSGLVVYWLVNNVLSIAQQWGMTRSQTK